MALAPAPTEAVYSKCVSECGNLLKEKLQEELQSTRELGPELISAATTFALYLAANWNMALLMSFLANFAWRGILHLVILFGSPTLPFMLNGYGVFTVWSLKEKLSRRNGVTSFKGWKSVGIMACCPIFIQLPPHTKPIQNVGVNDEDWDHTDSYVQKCCPLELPPGHPRVEGPSLGTHSLRQRADLEAALSLPPLPAAAQDTNPPSEAENAALEAPQDTNPIPEAAQGTNRPSDIKPEISLLEGKRDTSNPPSESEAETAQETNPPAQDTNPPSAAARDPSLPATADQQPTSSSGEKKYLLIDVTYETALAREVLLQLEFVPEYAQLRFLRSRTTFQTVVTALQAFGYLMGVVLRTAEGLAISPMEVILAYFCLLVGAQLVMEVYVCTHFQRPLLLRLNPDQFSQFYDELRQQAADTKSAPDHQWKVSLVISVVYNILAVPFVIKVESRSRPADCFLCSLSTNLVFYLPLFYFVLDLLTKIAAHAINAIVAPKQRSLWELQRAVVVGIAALVSSTGMVLAVVATCQNWKTSRFDTATSYRLVLNWLLPHVSFN